MHAIKIFVLTYNSRIESFLLPFLSLQLCICVHIGMCLFKTCHQKYIQNYVCICTDTIRLSPSLSACTCL